MKRNTKSSVTLPPKELALVLEIQKHLKAKSKVEVIRQGLMKLKEGLDRDLLKARFQSASKAVRESAKEEMQELDSLTHEGLGKK